MCNLISVRVVTNEPSRMENSSLVKAWFDISYFIFLPAKLKPLENFILY